MKEQQTAPLTTEELTEKYHKLRRTFILATVISIFGTIVMLPSVLFFKIPYALAGALVDVIYGEMLCWDMSGGAYSFEERTKDFCSMFLPAMMKPYLSESK